jgi:hypothetical protein
MPKSFLTSLGTKKMKATDRAIALIWWHMKHGAPIEGVKVSRLCTEIKAAGYGEQNASRLATALKKDRRTVANGKAAFSVNIKSMPNLDKEYLHTLKTKPVAHSDALFDLSQFKGTRNYLEKVVLQANRSYEEGLYDCCAVMVRRILETLIIEIYEKAGRSNEIQGGDGNFFMFSGLLTYIENDKKLRVGRGTMQALRDFKKIADNSAHNRRYNAIQKHIDDNAKGLQIAVTELIQMAFL